MRIEAVVLLVISAFFAVTAAVYWGTSYEDSGTVMLIGACLLGLLPGSYYLWWSRRMPPRPEDDPGGTIEGGAGVVGAFPSSSVWPFVLGLGFASIALAFVFGLWTGVFGGCLVVSAVIGVIVESRRGGLV